MALSTFVALSVMAIAGCQSADEDVVSSADFCTVFVGGLADYSAFVGSLASGVDVGALPAQQSYVEALAGSAPHELESAVTDYTLALSSASDAVAAGSGGSEVSTGAGGSEVAASADGTPIAVDIDVAGFDESKRQLLEFCSAAG